MSTSVSPRPLWRNRIHTLRDLLSDAQDVARQEGRPTDPALEKYFLVLTPLLAHLTYESPKEGLALAANLVVRSVHHPESQKHLIPLWVEAARASANEDPTYARQHLAERRAFVQEHFPQNRPMHSAITAIESVLAPKRRPPIRAAEARPSP